MSGTVTTVTMNPCVDRTVELAALIPGGTNPVLSSREDVSGKGINVSVALAQLGYDTLCLSFSHRGGALGRSLAGRGVPHRLAPAAGALRVNLKLFDRGARAMTECNEKGSPLSEGEYRAMADLVEEVLPASRLLVLSGSLPPGAPVDCYRSMAEAARAAGCPVLLDASGPALREGVLAAPLLIKPNREELEAAFGLPAASLPQAAASCRGLIRAQGVGMVCLSMGAEGALLVTREGAWFSPGAPIQVRGVQGAGDSMVAGFCAGLMEEKELPPAELLRWAVAAAHASLEREGTQMCDRAGFARMLPRIPVKKMDEKEN